MTEVAAELELAVSNALMRRLTRAIDSGVFSGGSVSNDGGDEQADANRAAARMQVSRVMVRDEVFARPNVRVEAGPTASRQARATDNVLRTCGPGLVACRWASPRTRG